MALEHDTPHRASETLFTRHRVHFAISTYRFTDQQVALFVWHHLLAEFLRFYVVDSITHQNAKSPPRFAVYANLLHEIGKRPHDVANVFHDLPRSFFSEGTDRIVQRHRELFQAGSDPEKNQMLHDYCIGKAHYLAMPMVYTAEYDEGVGGYHRPALEGQFASRRQWVGLSEAMPFLPGPVNVRLFGDPLGDEIQLEMEGYEIPSTYPFGINQF